MMTGHRANPNSMYLSIILDRTIPLGLSMTLSRGMGPCLPKTDYPKGCLTMSLIKDHHANSIQEEFGFPKALFTRVVESILEITKTTLVCGGGALISGFGKKSVRQKVTRSVRNPATGEDLALPCRSEVKSKCSPLHRDRVNLKIS